MRTLSVVVFGALCAAFLTVPAEGAMKQVVVDRILSRPYGEILTLSDVWQAIDLHLVDIEAVAGQSDAPIETRVQAALENRRLILREVNRLPVFEPPADALIRRRRDWEARLEPGTDIRAQLDRAGMTDQALTAWLRDDLRIEDHLAQRFSATPDVNRPAEIAFWVDLLRQRAGLR